MVYLVYHRGEVSARRLSRRTSSTMGGSTVVDPPQCGASGVDDTNETVFF
jgi:hypothetical protein